jgi:hypothetical protein
VTETKSPDSIIAEALNSKKGDQPAQSIMDDFNDMNVASNNKGKKNKKKK